MVSLITNDEEQGYLYLLHFAGGKVADHARHYLGYSNNPDERYEAHVSGQGSPLVKAAVAQGLKVEKAKTWAGTRRMERRLKKQKNLSSLCPTCRAEHLAKKAERMRRYRIGIKSSMRTINAADPQMKSAFEQAIMEHPLDPATRLIYGDYLEEHGHPEEAEQHRRMGRVMIAGFEGKGGTRQSALTLYGTRIMGQYGHLDPSIKSIRRGNRIITRPATPQEASLTAYRNSLVPLMGSPSLSNRALNSARMARRLARQGQFPVQAHESAAHYHLQAARDFEKNPSVSQTAYSNLRRSLNSLRILGDLGETLDLPESYRALEMGQIPSNSHESIAEAHEQARDANIKYAREGGGIPMNAYLGMFHDLAARAHRDAANRSGDRHRLAAYGHLIAANIHGRAANQ